MNHGLLLRSAGTLIIAAAMAFGQQMATLPTGATVSFSRSASRESGITINGSGVPGVSQDQPAQLEVFQNGNVRHVASGYKDVKTSANSAKARAHVELSDAVSFDFEDVWTARGAVLSLHRTVLVHGNIEGAGFYSAILLGTAPQVAWTDLDYLAPGLLYGGPANNGDRSPGGLLAYRARRISMREDFLQAPLFGVSFRDGHSVTVFDPAPRGDTTTEETRAATGTTMIDDRYRFGGFGANGAAKGGVEFGYWLPGTISDFAGGLRGPATPSWRRRYHPIRDGFTQSYDVAFRFGQSETFPEWEKSAWRWAWQTLNPPVMHLDVEAVRRVLVDHLAAWTITVDGRTGLPYLEDTRTGKYETELGEPGSGRVQQRPDATRAAMGFCAKNLEAADFLLEEGDRDPSPRGQHLRELGLSIIQTFTRLLPMSPPAADGFDLLTGKLEQAVWSLNEQFIRAPSDDLRSLLNAYRREKGKGLDHPEWLRYSQSFADWVMAQQREDGSFPRSWKPGTNEVVNPSGSATYSPIPLLVELNEVTGERKYLDSAVRAGEFLWETYGARGFYVGGAIDNPNITDKEGGLLSLEAFLSLYAATHEPRWLAEATHAADYTESWIRIWNVPMPVDGDDAKLHWKKEVSTVGLQGITARGPGQADEYLDWSAPAYARLYKYTHDEHYLEVTRILLHDTKSMLAMPGHLYGMIGPGWQQENWSIAYNRGYGTPGKSLPWVTLNHLHSIIALEDFDAQLYKDISANPR